VGGQALVTVPFPLRFPLAFDGKLLGQVLRIFIDTAASNYRRRLADWGIKRILRFLERHGVITLVTAPGDGEITVVTDETIGEKDPLMARLLAAATAGASPAGPTHKRAPVRIVRDPDATPVAKGKL